MLVCSLWLATSAAADEVYLLNGDRLTGKIEKMEDHVLTLHTDHSGEVKIDWGKIERLKAESPLKILMPGESGDRLHDFFYGTTSLNDVTSLSQNGPVPFAEITGINFDGGLVNPVPVSLARAMGADIVIAVDLNSDVVGAAWRNPARVETPAAEAPVGWPRKLLSRFGRNGAPTAADEAAEPEGLPSMLTVMQSSISIMSVRIARSRLAGEPADVLISPRLAQLA